MLKLVNFSIEGLSTTTGVGKPDTTMTFKASLSLPQPWGYSITDTTSTSGLASGEGGVNRVIGLYTKAYQQANFPRCILSIPNGPQTVDLTIQEVTGQTTFDTTTYPTLFMSAIFEIQELSP